MNAVFDCQQKSRANVATVTQSVLELRRIYSELDDDKFCLFYAKRYRQRYSDIKQILEKQRKV